MKSNKTSKFIVGIAALGLSTGVWANMSFDTMNMDDWSMKDPDYMVTDSINHTVKWLDGVDQGVPVADDGLVKHPLDCMEGDTITNLHTHKSGIIKGIKHHGTMDVVMPSGKTVRYEYVTFKVKPIK